MATESNRTMLTVRDVAARLNVSPGCVYRLVSLGVLPHIRIGAGRGTIRVDEADLAAFVEREKRLPPTSIKRANDSTSFTHLDGQRLAEAWRHAADR